MPRTNVAILGAGQAGLAMSHCLSERGIEHVVLERGAVGERWRTHGWDSLRLLTPNWMTRLPGFAYNGADPDGFMTTRELVGLLEGYAMQARAPIVERAAVLSVERAADEFRIVTPRGIWCAKAVVIATGFCEQPAIPAFAAEVPARIHQLSPADYRNPEQLSREGVLVVGASATGVQLADEIRASGRPVVLAVGRHTRLPRRYRGRDILWWLDRLGMLSQEATNVHNLAASRGQPSLQLVGRPDHASVDLSHLQARGVQLAGRATGVSEHAVHFADDLVATTAAADIKLATILLRIDEFIRRTGEPAAQPEPFVPTWPVAETAVAHLDFTAFATVIWATGYRRTYPWLHVPVLDGRGEIRHHGGVTVCPGLYVLGLNFQRRRNSSFLDGVGSDALYLADHLAAALDQQRIA